MRARVAGLAFGVAIAAPLVASAAESTSASRPGDVVAWLVLLALVPLVGLMLSCFVKIAVVLSVLRAGFGGRSIPPASVTFGLALVLSLFVMMPVGERMWRAMQPGLDKGDAASLGQAASAGAEPLRAFLEANVPERERTSFVDLQRRMRPAAERASVTEHDFVVLAPAFVVAELTAAFQVGFLLLLPFLVLDLLVANVLAALGMGSLEPRAVALPFKLLLFVLADGWHLLARGLVLGYASP